MTKAHGDPLHHCDYNAMLLAIKGDGVVSGLIVTQKGAGANMSVDVAAGLCVVDDTRYREAGVTNIVIEASEAGKHRKDTIIYDTPGSIPAVIKGTSVVITDAAVPPSVTAGDILLSVVYVGDAVSTIVNSAIYGGLVPVPARIIDASSPTTSDDTTLGYNIGDRWINTTADQEFVCVDASSGAAVWIETTSQLQDDFLEIIRQMHPNVSVLAALDDTEVSDLVIYGDDYILNEPPTPWSDAGQCLNPTGGAGEYATHATLWDDFSTLYSATGVTIETWIKTGSDITTKQMIFTKVNICAAASAYYHFSMQILASQFFVKSRAGTNYGTLYSSAISTNTIYHIIITWASDGSMTLYVEDMVTPEDTASNAIMSDAGTGASDFAISACGGGCDSGNPCSPLGADVAKCKIESLMIYNSVLSEANRTSLHNRATQDPSGIVTPQYGWYFNNNLTAAFGGNDLTDAGSVAYIVSFMTAVTTGNVLTDAIAANAAVLSFFSQLKGKFSNGASSHATPVGVEIFGNGDSYAVALNATTKFKIDPTDPRIELYRIDDSVVAKSGAQENWTLDDNATNGAFAAKTTSTHETILGEEIGCASVVMVEKSVNGAFTDTELLVEDDDYTVDYSTRTATKIILTASEAADIVISQSKLRITWIADVEDIEGTANTALKMKIYLNRTDTTEASPEIQKIDLGTDEYAEMKYMCG